MKNNYGPVDKSTQPKQSRLKTMLKGFDLCVRCYAYAEKFGLLAKLEEVDGAELLQKFLDLL
ncbi:hypothetical protein L3V35_12310 [Vibrio sp. L5-1]|uniref:hypothetical protein n=1 Tax=Vibrio sp. L5-1 TaxID=2912254 RepID=UPI001F1DF5BA|nr:hypothetical protein [Vibrio sp. L5-1]MCF7495826.1 hypothetical protein [Vibrio sp. L5-1]